MALHPDFPGSLCAILNPAIRWFSADEALRETSMGKLMPPSCTTPPASGSSRSTATSSSVTRSLLCLTGTRIEIGLPHDRKHTLLR